LKEIRIGNHIISDRSPVFIVAELSANHNKDFKLALKSLDAIKESGADAVKVQTYRPDSITIDSEKEMFRTREDSLWSGIKLYDLYKKGSLPYEWHSELQSYAEKLGLVFFSSPFDDKDVDFLETLNIPAYKIASMEITDIPLISYVASKGKPIILSSGIATKEDIQLAIDTCLKEKNDKLILLKCTSSYPTPPEDAHLNNILWLKNNFNIPIGLSDHTKDIIAPIVAVTLGAKLIEKHFILDKSIESLDAGFSLDRIEFSKMVASIREAEQLLGKHDYMVTEKMEIAKKSSRSVFVIKKIDSGMVFSKDNIKVIRPGFGIHPKYYKQILGKKAARDLEAGSPLSLDDITD